MSNIQYLIKEKFRYFQVQVHCHSHSDWIMDHANFSVNTRVLNLICMCNYSCKKKYDLKSTAHLIYYLNKHFPYEFMVLMLSFISF